MTLTCQLYLLRYLQRYIYRDDDMGSDVMMMMVVVVKVDYLIIGIKKCQRIDRRQRRRHKMTLSSVYPNGFYLSLQFLYEHELHEFEKE